MRNTMTISITEQEELFITTLHREEPFDNAPDLIKQLNTYDPSIIPHLTKLFATGTPTAQEAAKDQFFTLANITDSYPAILTINPRALPSVKAITTSAWYLETITKQCNLLTQAYPPLFRMTSYQTHHEANTTPTPLYDNHDYWTGLTLLALATTLDKNFTRHTPSKLTHIGSHYTPTAITTHTPPGLATSINAIRHFINTIP